MSYVTKYTVCLYRENLPKVYGANAMGYWNLLKTLYGITQHGDHGVIMTEALQQRIDKILASTLTKNQYSAVVLLFGLEGKKHHKMKTIASELKVSPEELQRLLLRSLTTLQGNTNGAYKLRRLIQPPITASMFLKVEVREMLLTKRTSNAAAHAKIITIGQLVSYSRKELKRKHMGKEALDEIEEVLCTIYDLALRDA